MVQTGNLLMRKPQMVAWLVVISSFAMFCLACGGGAFGTYWFFFESPVHLNTHLYVSRGIVAMQVGDLNDNVTAPNADRDVQINTVLQVPADSQGYLVFQDSYSKEILATVFLTGGSTVMLDDTSRPRFEWSKTPYSMTLSHASGHFIADVLPRTVSRSLMLFLQSEQGTAYLSAPGSYTVDALDQRLQLYTQYGEGVLYQKSDHAGQVTAGNVGVVSKTNIDVAIQPDKEDTLMSFGYDSPIKLGLMPSFWACSNETPDNPSEEESVWNAGLDKDDSQQYTVLHMYRVKADPQGPEIGHAENGCRYNLDKNPLDVMDYSTLSIRGKFRIVNQNVTTCGVVGSECPIMLELRYITKEGTPGVWRHGLYAERPPSDPGPTTCDTCRINHEQINEKTWYVYDSGDLFAQFPQIYNDPKNPKVVTGHREPAFITQIRIYASGHVYDVDISELAVIGGKG